MAKLKTIAPTVPYLTVPLGLYVFDNGWASILLYHLGIVTVLSLAGYWRLGKMLKRGRAYLVLFGVVIASALGGLFIFWFWPLIKLKDLLLTAELTALGFSGIPWLLFMLYYFTVNPVLEEVFWRGYLGNPALKPAWTDIWFAGYHVIILIAFVEWPWIISSFLVLVGAGWLWRQLARIYNGLTMPILSHAAADASIIGAIFLLARQISEIV